MKGLILKDLYCVRLQIFLSVLIMLFPYILFTIGMSPENSALPPEVQQVFLIFFYGALNYTCICLFSSFLLNTLDADVNCGWSRILRTFPVPGDKVVSAKLCATGIVLIILTAISLVFNIIGIFVYSLPVEPMITIPVCMALIEAAVLFPIFPVAMKHGTRFMTAAYIFSELLGVAVSVALIVTALNSKDFAPLLRCIFYIGSPVAAGLSAVLSSRSGKRLYVK